MPDIIITPSSGIIDFFPVSTRVGRIEGSGNTINIVNPSGFVAVSGSGLSINASSPNATFHAYSAVSGATLLNLEGTNGSLFSVVDNLSGTLMSVNNNAGLPVFEVFSDDRVVAGRFGQNDFVMTSGGNVGIGTSSPVSKLQVSGLVTANSGNFTNSLTVNGTGVSIGGHNHIIGDVAGLQSALDGKQASGSYAASSHTHTSSNITDFNSSVSGLLSVTSISAGSGIAVSSSSGNHTVSVNVIDCGIIGSGYTPPAIGQTLPFSVVLSSGISYSIPANCSSMKIWVIGGGGNGGKGGGEYYICAGGGGGAGGCAYKTWSNPVGSVSMTIGGPTQATSLSYSSQTITGNAGSNGQDGEYDLYIESEYNGQGGNGGTYSGGDGGANGSRGYGRLKFDCTSNGNGGGGIGGSYTGSTTQSTTGQSASDISGLLAALTAAGASVPFNITLSAGTNASTFGGGGAGNTTNDAGNGYFGGGGGGTGDADASGGVGGSGVVVISFS